MKRYLGLSILSLLLTSCLELEDTSTLKVQLINLESRMAVLEKRVSKLANETKELTSTVTKEVMGRVVEKQALLLADLEEFKKEQQRLQTQVEDLTFKFEGKERETKGQTENLLTKIEALELKLKNLEDRLLSSKEAPVNATSNKTTTSNQTSLSNQTQVQVLPQVQPQPKTETVKPLTSKQPVDKQVPEVPKELKEDELFDRAYHLYQKGEYSSARYYWEEYLKRFPKGRWVGQVNFWLGETYFKEKNYEEAIIHYQKLIDSPEPNPFKPKAMLKQAQAFLKLNDKKASDIILKRLVRTFPGTPEAKEGEKLLKSQR